MLAAHRSPSASSTGRKTGAAKWRRSRISKEPPDVSIPLLLCGPRLGWLTIDAGERRSGKTVPATMGQRLDPMRLKLRPSDFPRDRLPAPALARRKAADTGGPREAR